MARRPVYVVVWSAPDRDKVIRKEATLVSICDGARLPPGRWLVLYPGGKSEFMAESRMPARWRQQIAAKPAGPTRVRPPGNAKWLAGKPKAKPAAAPAEEEI